MPVYIEKSILDLPLIYLNGGRRGYQVAIVPGDMVVPLQAQTVQVALTK